jgi:hypothetical protein
MCSQTTVIQTHVDPLLLEDLLAVDAFEINHEAVVTVPDPEDPKRASVDDEFRHREPT